MAKRRRRAMSDAEIDQTTAEIRALAREHPEMIPRKVGEYVNLIVQGCKMHDGYLVELGHVCLQGFGLELATILTAKRESAGGDDE